MDTTNHCPNCEDLAIEIEDLRTVVAVNDEALQQILVVAANCDVDDGLETARCVAAVELLALKAQSSESAGKVLVGVEQHADFWLDAKLKEVSDGKRMD